MPLCRLGNDGQLSLARFRRFTIPKPAGPAATRSPLSQPNFGGLRHRLLGAILQGRPLQLGRESVEGVLTERGLFVVSEVLGNEDSVVKPIDFFTGPSLYQGATISGQGSVALILDAAALSAAAAALEGGH